MDAIKYHTHLLPSELSPEMVGRFAAISRQAIQSAPARIMFMGQQLGRTDGQWAQEAKRADMHHLICVSSKDDSTSSLEQNKWVGIAIVRGPLSPSEYNHPISIASGAADGMEARWRYIKLFLRPAHRNLNANKSFFDGIFGLIKEISMKEFGNRLMKERYAPAHAKVRVQAAVDSKLPVSNFYVAGGFQQVAKLSTAEILEFQGYLTEGGKAQLRAEDYETEAADIIELVYDIVENAS